MPNLDGGDLDAARARAWRNIASLLPYVERGEPIVVPGPTCSNVKRPSGWKLSAEMSAFHPSPSSSSSCATPTPDPSALAPTAATALFLRNERRVSSLASRCIGLLSLVIVTPSDVDQRVG